MRHSSGVAASPPGSRPSDRAPAGLAGFAASIPNAGRAYRFAELLSIAVRVIGRDPDQFIATAGNIKYLQRQKAIPHHATGRGCKAQYSYDEVLQSLVGLELQAIGLTPIQIAPLIAEHWPRIRRAAAAGLTQFIALPTAHSRHVIVGIQAGAIARAIGGDQ